MKKTLWIALVGLLLAGVVAVSAQEVLSANAVGYIKKTMPAGGKLVAVSHPLESMTSSDVTFGQTSLAEEMPTGSSVFFWNEQFQVWGVGGKSGKGWSAAQAQRVLAPGEGFFIKGNPAATEDVDVTMTGEVPSDATISRAIVGSAALSTVGNPYPVDMIFGDTDLAAQAPVGSSVFFWNEGFQVWGVGGKSGKGWSAAEAQKVIEAGEGFFMKQPGASGAWAAEKPYTWP